jgi:hypothetical protein
MMKILYYDCFSGISGNMNLGALIDLGIDKNELLAELNKLNVKGYELEISREKKMGIEGTKVTVNLLHEHHHHDRHHHEPHRNLNDIYEIIDNSNLSEAIKTRARKMFLLIGEAEAKIHGKSLQEIHFHEVGAVDSIVDIVGAAICTEKIGVDKIMASRIEVGGGFVTCAHGTFPVPAPATAEILKNIPVKKGTVSQETTTPTGAAILAVTVDEFTDTASLNIKKTGYGIGHKDLEIPNVLRVYLAETGENHASKVCYVTECNIDDMNPEMYDHIIDTLFNAGADDVYLTPVQMKKNRPAIKVSVLHHGEHTADMQKILLKESSTFGLRRYAVEKIELQRKSEEIDYMGQRIRVKAGYLDNQIIKAKPEYDDCKRAGEQLGIHLQKLYNDVNALISQKYFNKKP